MKNRWFFRTFLSKDLPKALKDITMSDAAGKFKVSRTLIGMAVLEKESMLTIKPGTLNNMNGFNFEITGVKLKDVYTSGFISGNKMYVNEKGKLYSINLERK